MARTAAPKGAKKTTDDPRMKALQDALQKVKRDHGESAVINMSDGALTVKSRPTGVLPLDVALGIGGVPRGRIIEIYGPESSGKTTLMYHLMAAVQQAGGLAAFVDAEHSMDPIYAGAIGVDVDALVVSQPDYGEQGLQIAQTLTESGVFDLIVIDSVAALTPKAEIEGQIGDSSVGLQARMMSQSCRILAGKANQTDTTIAFTNQIREKVGVMFGSQTQPGGRALKFYSSQRMDIRRIETIKDGTDAVANRVRVKVVKNKTAPPFKQAEFTIAFGVGVDKFRTLIDMHAADAEKYGNRLTKSGSFFTFALTGDRVQGVANAGKYLSEHPEVYEDLDAAVRNVHFPSPEADTDDAAAEPADDAALVAA